VIFVPSIRCNIIALPESRKKFMYNRNPSQRAHGISNPPNANRPSFIIATHYTSKANSLCPCVANLSSDRDTLLGKWWADIIIDTRILLVLLLIHLIDARLSIQEAAFLHWTTALQTSRSARKNVTIAAAALACIANAGGG
jgi:hypothetical protein